MSAYDDFEAISAYLDGEATTDEITRIEASPELLAQVAELRHLESLSAAPVTPPSDAVRDTTIAAALAVSSTAPNVTSLTSVKAQRSRVAIKWASVAAAVAVVMFAVPFVLSDRDGSSSFDTASDAGTEDAAAAAPAEASVAEEAASALDADTSGTIEAAKPSTDAAGGFLSDDSIDESEEAMDEVADEEMMEEMEEEAPAEEMAEADEVAANESSLDDDVSAFAAVLGQFVPLTDLTEEPLAPPEIAGLLLNIVNAGADPSDNESEPLPCGAALEGIDGPIIYTIVEDPNTPVDLLVLVHTLKDLPVQTIVALDDCVVVTFAEAIQ